MVLDRVFLFGGISLSSGTFTLFSEFLSGRGVG